MGQAKALLVGGRPAEALARAQKFIQDFSRSEETSDAREFIARCYLRLHRYEEAANALGKAAELAKDEKQAKSLVKECQELRNSLAEYEAVKQRIKSAAHRAELPALYLQLAKLCDEQLAKFEEALDAYGQVLLKYPQRKEAEGVEEKILRLQELAERSSEAELRIAAAAVSLLNLMEKAAEEASHITIKEHAGRALKLLEAFAAKYPRSKLFPPGEQQYQVARGLLLADRASEALEAADRLVASQRGTKPAQSAEIVKARCYLRLKRYSEAVKCLDRLAEVAGNEESRTRAAGLREALAELKEVESKIPTIKDQEELAKLQLRLMQLYGKQLLDIARSRQIAENILKQFPDTEQAQEAFVWLFRSRSDRWTF